ncbi:3-oxoacyl-ACP reductase FabG [Siccirubricoccus sp. KC 17139]|uniref:3-oxoacyl-ACP reductase FabG n=1 Tax=Siccirubricoccus soli TaxID=2899147 RepID=A0ABT1D7V8_9PROT|nr:3-oxoacyl-ACP reductase FabG [Siccirubricoccus soli]MCO6418008.1 3-oxoacyl-ACP reductase FabG [Siccirubricoccus soli]MCP2684143.1 3-oxoacyl-ACP reductase FabG [Siccirubricoccus soli]
MTPHRTGRRALVTGGASPIGAAICRALAAEGHAVLIHAHAGLERAEALAAELRGAGSQALAFGCDLTDMAATATALEAQLAAGPVQVFVHNAGTHDDVPLAGMSEAQWRGVVDVSLNGFFAALRPLILPMIGTRWGRIIAISSISALLGNRGQANYAAAKAGLIGAVKSVSLEYASRGVTANVVAPGIIASPAVTAAMSPARIAEMVPAKRAGRPEEVADLVAFLASDRAAYISGQTITVGGGLG